MNFLKILFYKFYISQVRFGNAEIAHFTSILILTGITILYFFDFLLLLSIYFNPLKIELNKEVFLITFFIILSVYFYIFIYKKKYKKIIKEFKKQEEINESLIHLIFVFLSVLLFIGLIVLKVFQNLGKF